MADHTRRHRGADDSADLINSEGSPADQQIGFEKAQPSDDPDLDSSANFRTGTDQVGASGRTDSPPRSTLSRSGRILLITFGAVALIVAVAVGLLVVPRLVASPTPSVPSDPVPQSGGPSASFTSRPVPTAPITGRSGESTQWYLNSGDARLTATFSWHTEAANEALPPAKDRQYLVTDVDIQCLAGSCTVSQLYFLATDQAGNDFPHMGLSGYGPALPNLTLQAGQTIQGRIVFEVPAEPIQVTVTDELFNTVIDYQVPQP